MAVISTRLTQFADALSVVSENADSNRYGIASVDHAHTRFSGGGARLALDGGAMKRSVL